MSVAQKLLLDTLEIENLSSSLEYSYILNDASEDLTGFLWHQAIFYRTYEGIPDRHITQNLSRSGVSSRNIQCVEVLDYDYRNREQELAIIFYKKITITHSQTKGSTQNKYWGASVAGVFRDVGHSSFAPMVPDSETSSDSFDSSGTRKVEYFLFYKIGDKQEKIKLAEFNSEVSRHPETGVLVHSGSGERLWGVSCQLNKDIIVYHYQKETYLNNGSAPGYDAPMNFEDVSYQGVLKLWSPQSVVVGCINAGSDLAKKAGLVHKAFEFDPAPAELIYSVGLHRRKPEKFEQEEL
jgi:hypothetical protein